MKNATILIGIIIAAIIGIGLFLQSYQPKIQQDSNVQYTKAPEAAGIEYYINTQEGTKLSDFKGKVVIVDFWTYTCINCIRTLPYMNAWYSKYKDKGLEIVGVHTPEFAFEKDPENVKQAVNKYEIKYPVLMDNEYQTWRAFKNAYWPRKYILDVDGYIRYDHIGEGGYEETEKVIQELLTERANKLRQKINLDENLTVPSNVVQVDFGKVSTPELYFGYEFIRSPLGNPEGYKPEGSISYKLPEEFTVNYAYLEGTWKSNKDNMELVSDKGKIALKYRAKVANIVAGRDNPASLMTSVDGKLSSAGDAKGGHSTVQKFQLYNIANSEYGEHTLIIDVEGKGFKLFTFTFG